MNYRAEVSVGSDIGSYEFTRGGLRGGAEKRSLLVENDVDGEMGEQLLELFLFAKGAKKLAIL